MTRDTPAPQTTPERQGEQGRRKIQRLGSVFVCV